MQIILLRMPPAMGEALEQQLHAQRAHGVDCEVVQAPGLETLPDLLPPGLVVVWDAGGPLEELAACCRQLDARRVFARTQLLVLTQRDDAGCEALAEAGADECLAPPGGLWGARLKVLQRRLKPQGEMPAAMSPQEFRRASLEQSFQSLMSGLAAAEGDELFRGLVAQLGSAFHGTGALVGVLTQDQEQLRTLAFWSGDRFEENLTFALQGTVHQEILLRGSVQVPEGIQGRFPGDPTLPRLGAQACLGVGLRDAQGRAIGVLAVGGRGALLADRKDQTLFEVFAARAEAELGRLRAEAELVRTRVFLRTFLEAVPDPIFIKDRAHRWILVNAAFAQALGLPMEKLVGRSDYDLIPAHEAGLFWERDEQVFSSGRANEFEERLTDPSGNTRIIITKKAPFTLMNGEPFLIGVIRDITEARRMETQLRLSERMASVGTLAAGVAHEINNPLAYISSNLAFLAEQLEQEELPAGLRAEMRDAVLESLEGTRRVRLIVQDLKSFSRSDDDSRGPVDVHRVIQGSLRLVRNELEHRARLSQEFRPVPAVLGNESRLAQVIVNLLVNAVQALPSERAVQDNRIHVAAWHEAEWVCIEVEDNGQGIAPEVQRHIFDPFFTTKPVGVGTGLGLSICNTIIQSMGGSIEVESTPSEGSTFRLRLPVLVAPGGEAEPPPEPPLPRKGPRRRVLLIDDEPSVGAAVRRLLHAYHEVHAVQDAREALQLLLRGEHYDAILCDVMMKGMSGVDFILELESRAPELVRHTGLMSAGLFSEQARAFIASRELNFLRKPFEREGLRLFVEHLCG
ncbi:PAS domain S-box-containing protein [Stigmatella aurantiaca]|uniref:histidine kinase n=1 Tax=Stigmatella aurantiaca TaxID=41 RepID=A0A1H7H4J6_STIAU|nr:hybrid sensor histidine kinase/response regulator [Stigmatella aurantiaca]SEK45346.1 PAS domain S-box-containing protein [Stigmatella aurantiaca]